MFLNMLIGGLGLISVVVAVCLVFRALVWGYSKTEVEPTANPKTCPCCSGDMREDDVVCRHCGSILR
jgi:predicted amidophosphoribosyltransferase